METRLQVFLLAVKDGDFAHRRRRLKVNKQTRLMNTVCSTTCELQTSHNFLLLACYVHATSLT